MERTIIRCENCERFYLGALEDEGGLRIIGSTECYTCGSTEFTVVEKDEL